MALDASSRRPAGQQNARLADRPDLVRDRRSDPPRQLEQLQHRPEQRVVFDRVG